MEILKRFISGIILLLITNVSYSQTMDFGGTIGRKGFRAAVVKVDITPEDSQYLLGYGERRSTGVYNHIYHRIVALDDGEEQFFLISTEVCVFSPAYYDRVSEKIQGQLGISPLNLWWTATHTHSAPELGPPGLPEVFMGERYHHEVDWKYTAFVEEKLIEGIKEARAKLSPARLGVGWGHSLANINRRAIDVNGKASLGLNPDGATDRRIGLLRIDREDGTPLACIANYPIHGTVLGSQNLEISGDAPGIVSEYFEQEMEIPLLFINGAAGNIAPLYSTYPNPVAGHLSQFRVLLGDKVISAYKKITYTTDQVKLNSGAMIVETPRKQGLGWPGDMGDYNHTTSTGLELVKLPIRFLKINDDIAIWSAPLELFCEISNEIRNNSPFPYTFYFGYTNGWLGYLLTEEEYKYEGYEPTVSPYTPRAAGDLTEAVITYLQGK